MATDLGAGYSVSPQLLSVNESPELPSSYTCQPPDGQTLALLLTDAAHPLGERGVIIP